VTRSVIAFAARKTAKNRAKMLILADFMSKKARKRGFFDREFDSDETA
jgi:hypothetical protein